MDTGLDSLKTATKKIIKLVIKIAEAVTNSHYDKIVKAKPVEEIIVPIERRKVILKELAQVLKKWNTTKYLSY